MPTCSAKKTVLLIGASRGLGGVSGVRHSDDPWTLLLMAPGWVRGLHYLDYLGRVVPW
ncbi:hypothetical protein [Serratia plymuthica]|uniref:hypothetical protein n=1 Tax=Serratia plymuthica TaxID=82996 RepID=UPI002015FEB1|nr:hypothetical protein [Serratia plymuthica]